MAGLLAVVVPLVGAAAPAGAATEAFTLTMEQGRISIRGSQEPAPLARPTVVAGTNADGSLTGVSFTTPGISFARPVTDPVATTAHIDAAFTQVAPGTASGSISPDGDVIVSTALRVDLHIEVEILAGQEFTCSTQPVELTLTGRHDGSGVDLVDEDFTVPAAPVTARCPDFVADAINGQLQGAGHSLSLSLAGALTPPPDPGEPTTTTLAVVPAEPTDVGEAVTLTATVAPAAAADTGVPQGVVSFRDGPTEVGTAALDGTGRATLVTSALLAGPRKLTAVYGGNPPDYAPSTSPVASHRVVAGPVVAAELAPTVAVGAATDLSVVAVNTGFGRDLPHARIDVAIQRTVGSAPIGPAGSVPRLELASRTTGSTVEVPLTFQASPSPGRLVGSITDELSLAVGETRTEELRLTVRDLVAGSLRLTFGLVTVDPDTGAVTSTVASGAGEILVVEADRRDSFVDAGAPGDDFFPPVAPVAPVAARAGTSVMLQQLRTGPSTHEHGPSGTLRFFVDGRPVPAKALAAGVDGAYAPTAPVEGTGSGNSYWIQLPADLGPGTHQISVSYGGNAHYRPSAASWPIRIEATRGAVVECRQVGAFQAHYFANLEAFASMPAAVRGGRVDLSDLRVALLAPRAGLEYAFQDFARPALAPDLRIELGPDGGGAAAGAVEGNAATMNDEDGLGVDHSLRFTGISGHVAAVGAPGDPLAVTVAALDLTVVSSTGLRQNIRCVPVEAPMVMASSTIAGTTLEASPAGPVRAGAPVTLRAVTAPSAGGNVEFRADGVTVGLVPVEADGRATLVTSDLPEGDHALSARYLGGVAVPMTTSDAVSLRVGPALDCAAYAGEGSGAVVRLVYMELLGRCPDRAGYDHWKGRLDGGTSADAFARAIVGTPEAVGRVVDDAYRTMLGRRADAPGRAFWVQRMRTGSGRYDQLLADLGASDEFRRLSGATPSGVVTRVYERLLGRAPDGAGLAYWVGRLDAGATVRAVVVSLANQDEPLGRMVGAAYEQILGRSPGAGERGDGVAHLRATGDRPGLAAQLIGRPEFSTRAQGFPNPED